MSNTILSPNMSLPVPIVGVDPGPDWANNYNSALSILDQHNHSSGSGVQIAQTGIRLTANGTTFDSLNFNTSNAYGLRSAKFINQASPLALSTDVGSLYESGSNLYFNNGAGVAVQITSGNSIVGTAGSISGLPSGTASAAYAGGIFTFQSATSTPAGLSVGPIAIGQQVASPQQITIQSPNSLAASYSLTLPMALPVSTSFLLSDSAGNISASNATSVALSVSTITATSLVVTTDSAKVNGQSVVVSANPATNPLMIVRGNVSSAGAITSGEGFTVSGSAGTYNITFSTSFLDAPAVTANTGVTVTIFFGNAAATANVSTTGATVFTYNPTSGSVAAQAFSFIAIGQRST